MNGTELINKAGKWISTSHWELPPEESTGYIKNIDTDMVLGVVNDSSVPGSEVLEGKINLDKTGQKWKRGNADKEGYFTLIKCGSEDVLLTAKSKKRLTIEGMYMDIN